VGLAPEAKTDESSSSVADIKAVLTAASGRSLPLSVVRLPCGQLEVRAVAFCTRCTFRTMVLPFVAHRGRSPCVLTVPKTSRAIAMMDTRPFDLRHVTSVVDAGEAGHHCDRARRLWQRGWRQPSRRRHLALWCHRHT
jgi:hypothetical protein